ncbi:MAG: hypothetical protein IPK97_09680 [Ahniella sp.]|nr:hypothetical protein [Ahniella sp.]
MPTNVWVVAVLPAPNAGTPAYSPQTSDCADTKGAADNRREKASARGSAAGVGVCAREVSWIV